MTQAIRSAASDRPLRLRWLFALLYFSEGAPIGFLWLALPTLLRTNGLSPESITALTSTLIIPWTLKFLWAPLVDRLQFRYWTLRHWITTCQLLMAATLAPLLWMDIVGQWQLAYGLLLAHAFCAATQDVAIDAWCMKLVPPEKRGSYNGWMQCGMLVAMGVFGGASLIVWSTWGGGAVIGCLIASVLFPTPFIWMTQRTIAASAVDAQSKIPLMLALRGFVHRRFLLGFGFALTAGAAFEAQGGVQGTLLVDRELTQEQIGQLQLLPILGLKVAGALIGGWLADRLSIRPVLVAAMAILAVLVTLQGQIENWFGQPSLGWCSVAILLASNLVIGVFIASSYAMLMNQSTAGLAATQFTAFMSATNACEAWSTRAVGAMHTSWGYPGALATMAAASLIGLVFLAGLPPAKKSAPAER